MARINWGLATDRADAAAYQRALDLDMLTRTQDRRDQRLADAPAATGFWAWLTTPLSDEGTPPWTLPGWTPTLDDRLGTTTDNLKKAVAGDLDVGDILFRGEDPGGKPRFDVWPYVAAGAGVLLLYQVVKAR